MVHLKALFATRRVKIVFIAAVTSLVLVSGVVIGLVFGLRNRNEENSGVIQQICDQSHETYVINGTSKLGKYNRAAVAVDNAECSKIGREILEKNGTSMDAALAAAICNGVMNAHSMGIGGGCIMTIYSKKENKAYSLIGREMAPAAADKNMFVGRENMSTTGGLAIGVPGELMAYEKAYQLFGGGVPWEALFEPTIRLCREGFIVSVSQAAAISQSRSHILKDPTLRSVFVKNNETLELYRAGDVMKRLKLADTLEIIAKNGSQSFYSGELADVVVRELQERGSIITKNDLANYHVAIKEALPVQISDSLIGFTTHAPSSGPILSFILNILRGYRFGENDLKNPEKAAIFYHRLIEAFKFAYAKRTELGDPDKIEISNLIYNLTSKDYADNIRSKIRDDRTFGVDYYGGSWLNRPTAGTAHLSVVGLDGDAVGLTSTVNLYFGSKVMGAETGIIYNNEMDDFSTPGTINSFGVPASSANFIEPGKRPVSSMAPLVIIEKDTQRIQLVLGASGGTRITTSIALVSLLNLIFSENIKEAIDSPRLHSQLLPDEVVAERGFNGDILKLLRQRGHNITCGAFGGSVIQGIEWRDTANQYWANSDIRKGGEPDGI